MRIGDLRWTVACGFLALPLFAQLTPPVVPAAHRGGYGGTPAAPSPLKPAAPRVGSAQQTPNWMIAAQMELGEDAEEVLKRGEAMDGEWKPVEAKIDARTRELLRQNGFSDADIAAYYHPPKEPADYSSLYRSFYQSAHGILSNVDLRGVSNPPLFSTVNDLVFPFGNEAAVRETLAALRRDMDVYHRADAAIEELLAVLVGRDAEKRFIRADADRYEAQAQVAGKTGDAGYYDDAANTAERARERPLAYLEQVETRRQYVGDHTLGGWELQLLRELPTFAEFERLSRRRTFTVATRTDPLVPFAEVVQVFHEHVRSLARRDGALAGNVQVTKWMVDTAAFHAFYQREAEALAVHLKGWGLRRGATAAEMDELGAQMKASESIDGKFASELQQNVAYVRQIVPLNGRVSDLSSEYGEYDGRSEKSALAGDKASADALRAQANALHDQLVALSRTTSDLVDQNSDLEKSDATQAGAAHFIEPDTRLRVAWVEFDFEGEAQPRKDANPTYPLKGAPVQLGLSRNIPEAAMGIPTVIRMFFSLEKGDAPVTQTLKLKAGATTVPVTLYLSANGYLSANVILQPGATTPGTTSR